MVSKTFSIQQSTDELNATPCQQNSYSHQSMVVDRLLLVFSRT
jgi:hypothetical protein